MRYVVLALVSALLFSGAWFMRPPVHALSPSHNSFHAAVIAPEASYELPNADAILRKVNEQRLARGLSPLVSDPSLQAIAETRAADMATHTYYAHKSPKGLYFDDLLVNAGIYNQYACENLDLQFVTTTETYVNDWLKSRAGHRECMLNPDISRAGYAVAEYHGATNGGSTIRSYVVVAIQTTEPQTRLTAR